MALNPFSLRRSDLQKNGKFVEEHRLYRLWFEFLALSPSYELARRFRKSKGKLTGADKARIPSDLAQVLQIYDAFGDVQTALFKTWWQAHGVELFGITGEPSAVAPIYKMANSEDPDLKKLHYSLKCYLDSTWPAQRKPGAIILAIPLNSTRQKVLKTIKQLLDEHIEAPTPQAKPMFSLATKDLHIKNVIDAMSVLWIRSAKPEWELWKIGVEANISKLYSKKYDAFKSKRTTANYDEFRTLEQMTSRKFKIAVNIAENAARGIFPSQKACPHSVKFDAAEFNHILSAKTAWIKQEKVRILANTAQIK